MTFQRSLRRPSAAVALVSRAIKALIALAVPGRPIRSWSRRAGAATGVRDRTGPRTDIHATKNWIGSAELTCLDAERTVPRSLSRRWKRDFIVELGPFGGPDVRLRINREPPVTAIVLWTPSAEQPDRRDELMQGGPYDIALPNGESWRMAPEEWQQTPEGKVVVTLRSVLPRPHGPDGTPFKLDMEAGVTEAEKREVSQVFRSIGFEPGDVRLMERRGLGDYPWLVTVSLPLAIFLKSFLEQAGKDAAEALRDFIKRIFKARESSGQDGQFVLIDEDSGIRLTILGELSVKACRKLLELDPSQLGDQYNALVYNEEIGEWELW
jgi:hypothetical protein